MPDAFSETRRSLEQMEAADVQRHHRPPEEPLTEAETLARQLRAARSKPALRIDASWLTGRAK